MLSDLSVHQRLDAVERDYGGSEAPASDNRCGRATHRCGGRRWLLLCHTWPLKLAWLPCLQLDPAASPHHRQRADQEP